MKKWIRTGTCILLCTSLGTGGACATPAKSRVPPGIRALLSPTDTLLAYKPLDVPESGGASAVIVVRHEPASDRTHNPCDLTILRNEGKTLIVAASSNWAVECIYNDITRRANELALDDQLEVKPGQITWSNELVKGHAAFTFAYATETSSWNLQRAEVTYSENALSGISVNVYKEVASYPGDFPRIALSDFNPRAIRAALSRHRETVK